jgi:succinoglycan biosynthesis protein ExoM
MLRACLDSLAAQVPPSDVAMHIVVVDNEEQPNNQAGVEAFAAACPFPVHYVHQPRRGIAAARNAILDKAVTLDAEQIVMLDDDETADPQWVADLMTPEYRHIPVLMGHRIWVYPERPPFWTPAPSTKRPAEGAPAQSFATNNVRFSAALLRAGLRFDEALALTGGEDQRFFNDAVRAGFRIQSTNRARTFEAVHPARLTYRFMITRHYAHIAALTSHKIKERGRIGVLSALLSQLLNVPLGCLELAIAPVAYVAGPRGFKKFALRGGRRFARVFGVAAALLGRLPEPYQHIAGH